MDQRFQTISASAINSNKLTYDIPPLTACHFMLSKKGGTPNSISILDDENVIRVYPNPANDIVYVDWNKDNFHPTTIQLINMNGRIVMSNDKIGSNNSYKINTSSLSNGMYTIRLTNGKKSIRNVITIER